MGTRSYIGVENADNTVSYVYCHWDGYVEGVGAALIEDYNSVDAAAVLVSAGDRSTMDETYADRGDSWESIKPGLDANTTDYFCDDINFHRYLMTQEGTWVVALPGESEPVELVQQIVKEILDVAFEAA